MSTNPNHCNNSIHPWLYDCAASCAAHLHERGRADLEKIERYRMELESALSAAPASSVEAICNYTTHIKTLGGKYLNALLKSVRKVLADRMGIVELSHMCALRFSALSVDDGKLVSFNLTAKDNALGPDGTRTRLKRTMLAYDSILKSLHDRTVTATHALKVIVLLDGWYQIHNHAPKDYKSGACGTGQDSSLRQGEEFIPSERAKGDQASKANKDA